MYPCLYSHDIGRIVLAGVPAAITLAGNDFVTKLFAPTRVPFPILTPFNTMTFTPSHTSSSIKMGASSPVRGSSLCQSVSVISVFAPQRTLSPRMIFFAHPITVPLNPQPVPISMTAFSARVDIIHGRFTPMRLEFGQELKPQPEPIAMLLLGCRLKYARPWNQQSPLMLTPHHFASIYALSVESRRFANRNAQ